jgi:hypothetical protein
MSSRKACHTPSGATNISYFVADKHALGREFPSVLMTPLEDSELREIAERNSKRKFVSRLAMEPQILLEQSSGPIVVAFVLRRVRKDEERQALEPRIPTRKGRRLTFHGELHGPFVLARFNCHERLQEERKRDDPQIIDLPTERQAFFQVRLRVDVVSLKVRHVTQPDE